MVGTCPVGAGCTCTGCGVGKGSTQPRPPPLPAPSMAGPVCPSQRLRRLPGQAGPCLCQDTGGGGRGLTAKLLRRHHQAWICPDAVQQSPHTERASSALAHPKLDVPPSPRPGPHLYTAGGVFLTKAHPLDREGRLEEEPLHPVAPPPHPVPAGPRPCQAQMWVSGRGDGSAN